MSRNGMASLAAVIALAVPAAGSAAAVFINEFHYDNEGGDLDEGVEIAARAGTDLAGWHLYLYNGSNGALYDDLALSGMVPDQAAGFGALFFPLPGLQNGPDGIALVDDGGGLVQFLSYEGSFVATDGPAAGVSSADIGVAEIASIAGTSLQLNGRGQTYADFGWAGPADSSYGSINAGQQFVALPLPAGFPLLVAALALLLRAAPPGPAGRRTR